MGVKIIFEDTYGQLTSCVAVKITKVGNCVSFNTLDGFNGNCYKFSGRDELLEAVVHDFYTKDKIDLRTYDGLKAE